MKKILIVFFLLVFPLCGCKGYRETDSEYFATAVCFQKKDDDFKAHIEVLAISEEDKKPESKVFVSSGKTPYSAVAGTTALMPKNAVFDHCGTAMIDGSISGEDFKSVIEYLYDTKNLNLGIFMFFTDDIEGVLDCDSQAASVGYDIMATEANITKTSGISFKNKYYEICARQIKTGGFCLPIVSKEENRPAVSGEMIFADYYPAVRLNKDEAQIFNLIYSGSSGGEISVSGKRCRVNGITSRVKQKGDTLRIELDCRYRFSSDNQNGNLKNKIDKLLRGLYKSEALKVLGLEEYAQIKKAEVNVNAE